MKLKITFLGLLIATVLASASAFANGGSIVSHTKQGLGQPSPVHRMALNSLSNDKNNSEVKVFG